MDSTLKPFIVILWLSVWKKLRGTPYVLDYNDVI